MIATHLSSSLGLPGSSTWYKVRVQGSRAGMGGICGPLLHSVASLLFPLQFLSSSLLSAERAWLHWHLNWLPYRSLAFLVLPDQDFLEPCIWQSICLVLNWTMLSLLGKFNSSQFLLENSILKNVQWFLTMTCSWLKLSYFGGHGVPLRSFQTSFFIIRELTFSLKFTLSLRTQILNTIMNVFGELHIVVVGYMKLIFLQHSVFSASGLVVRKKEGVREGSDL